MDTPPQTKRCPACGHYLPHAAFHKNRRTGDGLQSRCKVCHGKAVYVSLQKKIAAGSVVLPEEKKCPRCDRVVPLAGWDRNKTKPDGLQNHCKECHHASGRQAYRKRKEADPAWYEACLSSYKSRMLDNKLRTYGLDQETYDRLEAAGCAICGGQARGRGRYHFDHDHASGEFRGLLCSWCNTALGLFQDDPALLAKAAEYLRQHKHPCQTLS